MHRSAADDTVSRAGFAAIRTEAHDERAAVVVDRRPNGIEQTVSKVRDAARRSPTGHVTAVRPRVGAFGGSALLYPWMWDTCITGWAVSAVGPPSGKSRISV